MAQNPVRLRRQNAQLNPLGQIIDDLAEFAALDDLLISTIGQQFDESLLSKWMSARGDAMGGIRSSRILCVGDSMTCGAGLGGKVTSWPTQLAKVLTARGIPASHSNYLGDGNSFANSGVLYGAYDPRVVLGAGWAVVASSNIHCAGGEPFVNSTTLNSLAFTPIQEFDSIIVQHLTSVGGGEFTVSVDGGAPLATIDPDAPNNTLESAEINCALGLHTIHIRRTGVGGGTFINGVSAFQHNAVTTEVQVLSAGMGGGTSGIIYPKGALLTQADWGRDRSYTAWNPDLAIIMYGFNDLLTGIPVATFITNMQTIISSRMPATADILVMVYPGSNPSIYPIAGQLLFREAMRGIARDNNVIAIDIPARWGEFADRPTFYLDQLHPNGSGNSDIALILGSILAS